MVEEDGYGNAAAAQFGAIILAAGRSSRMGQPKALLPLWGSTFAGTIIHRLCAVATGADKVVVVVGKVHGRRILRALAGSGVLIAQNPDPAADMFSSVCCGVKALSACVDADEEVAAFFVIPVDAPAIAPGTYRKLAGRFLRDRPGVVRPCFAGRRGHPALVSMELRSELLAWHGKDGLRGLLRRMPDQCLDMPVEDPGILLDVDTPAEYRSLIALPRRDEFEPIPDRWTAAGPTDTLHGQQLPLLGNR